MNRRSFVQSLGAGVVVVGEPRLLRATAALPTMTVYKSPSCWCCKNWVAAIQRAGFTVKVVDLDDLSEVKRNAGVPDRLQSCHTGLVGAYVVEGHVPADLIQKMLAEKPAILGLAVPGMVVGSPGMEQGNTKQPYDVIAFERSGKTSVFANR
jgi:hypothetical protein